MLEVETGLPSVKQLDLTDSLSPKLVIIEDQVKSNLLSYPALPTTLLRYISAGRNRLIKGDV